VSAEETIPVYRARLPLARELLPYLERIDANRWYSNHGELVLELEGRLAELTAPAEARWVTASSGTAALEAAILATAGRATPARPLALVPAYTFVATAMAVERCGYVPHFVDVNDATWSLDADELAAHPLLSRAGVVVPVMAYGRGSPQRAWRRFHERTGTPVVIDAAAAFESLVDDPCAIAGTIPVTLSFHATKPFGTGEGGAVVWSDSLGSARVARALNFGFLGARVSQASGMNGKMSEYHAAVGLASLDGLAGRRTAIAATANAYRNAFAGRDLHERIALWPQIASSYAIFAAGSEREAQRVVAALTHAGSEHRFWYGRGIHREPSLSRYPGDALPNAERLAASLVGMPFSADLTNADIERIATTVARAVTPARESERGTIAG
jgi:dTDP-4-amino-4,6-dideoxygalactose transaminase